MSLFKRKPSSAARAQLADATVRCTAPGVDHVEIDYDPAVWVRTPVVGQDRTLWVEQSVAAYAQDRGLAHDDSICEAYEAVLNAVADHGSDAMATYVTIDDKISHHLVAAISVLDDESMLLENGTPESFLGFTDDPSREPEAPQWWPGDRFRFSGRGGYDDAGRYVRINHLYRALHTDPVLHLVGNVAGDYNKAFASLMRLFDAVRVRMDDGRAL